MEQQLDTATGNLQWSNDFVALVAAFEFLPAADIAAADLVQGAAAA